LKEHTVEKTDTQLKNDIEDELLRRDPKLNAAQIGVSVDKGVVTLLGAVDSYAEKFAAEDTTKRVAGVRTVAQDLTVKVLDDHPHSDADLASGAQKALTWDVFVPDTVRAVVDQGSITLSGTVTWNYQRDAAEHAVRNLAGVVAVCNNVTIKPQIDADAGATARGSPALGGVPGPNCAGPFSMLRSLKDLERYTVAASDGDLGRVVDFLIDDEHWMVRHLVVETGGLLEGRRVLISPISFQSADWSNRCFHVNLTMDRVKNSPSDYTDLPVSRQHEWDNYRYYGYPVYWGDFMLGGIGDSGLSMADGPWNALPPSAAPAKTVKSDDIHLRSAREVRGYHVDGRGEEVGHVDDFVVDDLSWEVRYLAVATSAWWFGKKVLISPRWATRIDWAEGKVFVDQSREAIKASPQWDPEAPINREYEVRLFDYYGRPVYWQGDAAAAARPL
jgi:osmotically-inducible protein OsmY/sporulation protein YlmC with PRC-barrel domain